MLQKIRGHVTDEDLKRKISLLCGSVAHNLNGMLVIHKIPPCQLLDLDSLRCAEKAGSLTAFLLSNFYPIIPL